MEWVFPLGSVRVFFLGDVDDEECHRFILYVGLTYASCLVHVHVRVCRWRRRRAWNARGLVFSSGVEWRDVGARSMYGSDDAVAGVGGPFSIFRGVGGLDLYFLRVPFQWL